MLRAKTVMQDRFWILENDQGIRQGTVSVQPNSVKVVINNVEKTYEDLNQACWDLGLSLEPKVNDDKFDETPNEDVMGFPTRCQAFNPTWDIRRKIPVFTKTPKSRTLHAAGFYIIHFEHGWVHSFCPKVSTLDLNEHQGPFKDKLEMRERLRKVHASDVN